MDCTVLPRLVSWILFKMSDCEPSPSWLSLVWGFHSCYSRPRHPWNKVWQQAHLRRQCRGIESRVSQLIVILSLVMNVHVDTSVLLHCYYVFVLQILEHCSLMWGSTADCHCQLLGHHLSRRVLCTSLHFSQALTRSEFLVIVWPMYCGWTVYAVQGYFEQESLFVQWVSKSFYHCPAYTSCCCISSIRVRNIEVKNILICNIWPKRPGSYVEWPSRLSIWHRIVGIVSRSSQPLVASPRCIFFSFPWCWCLWGCGSNS